MKTAISIPDAIYERAETKAHELGVSRSQFYATAADLYLGSLETDALADAIDAAIDIIGVTDQSNQAAVSASRSVIAGEAW